MRGRMPAIATLLLVLWSGAINAEQTENAKLFEKALLLNVPNTWQIHVAQREGNLFGFVTPPYQEAFNLWYDPQKLYETLAHLCPPTADPIWVQLQAGIEVELQPTVGGKSANTLRVKCAH